MRLDFIYKSKRNWNGIMDLFFLWIVIICVLICLTILIIFFIWHDNNRLTVSRFSFHSSKISRPIRILQLSDLHNKQFGKENSLLNKVITEQHPDLIVFTGDLEDRRKSYQKESVLFLHNYRRRCPFILSMAIRR
jgi:predicted MPP superfamily phosphohydrolase